MEAALGQSAGKAGVHGSVWVGRVLSGLVVLATAASGVMKLTHAPAIVEGLVQHLGYSESALTPIGIVEIACGILYAIPKTRILGGLLLTAYLGGATASHVRVGEPFIAPVVLGIVVWVGLYLRDSAVRALVPVVSSKS